MKRICAITSIFLTFGLSLFADEARGIGKDGAGTGPSGGRIVFLTDASEIEDAAVLASVLGGRYDEGAPGLAFAIKRENEDRPEAREFMRKYNNALTLVTQIDLMNAGVGLVSQVAIAKLAVANADQACRFLTFLAGPQVDSGIIFSARTIAIIADIGLRRGWIKTDFSVEDPGALVNYSAALCGYSSGSAAGVNTMNVLKAIAERGKTANSNDHTILLTADGRFLWDPYKGGANRIVAPTPGARIGVNWGDR